jgi:hypothetical protein
MFKRKQYYDAGAIYSPAEKSVSGPNPAVSAGSNLRSAVGSLLDAAVNSDAMQNAAQGFMTAAGGPNQGQLDQFGYQVGENKKAREDGREEPFPTSASDVLGHGGKGQQAPTAIQRWAKRTRQPNQSVAQSLQRISSGVGAHPGYKGSGKGAGGSVGQEVRAARKAKRKAKRTIESGEGGYEGGRVEKSFGGLVSRISSKLLKKFGNNSKVKSLVKQIKKEEVELKKFEKVIAKQESPEQYVSRIKEETGRDVHAPETDLWTDEMWDSYYTKRSRDIHLDELEEVITELDTVDEMYVPRDYSPDDEPFAIGGRVEKAIGGELDAQMVDMMEEPTHTMPDGTEMPGATHGEYEQGLAEGQAEDMAQEGMVPDEQMEEDYVDYIVQSSELASEDINYLEEALAADDRLSMIFDQIVETASEFSGSGPIDGPGSEVSDSIPARLSDGEFVITSKAAEEIGPDNLQGMMEEAEAASDVRQAAAYGGMITGEEDSADASSFMAQTVDPTEREMKKLQLAANPRTQYRPIYG